MAIDNRASTDCKFTYQGKSIYARCGYCERFVDNHDPDHRVTSLMDGYRGVECVLFGDISSEEAQPLGAR